MNYVDVQGMELSGIAFVWWGSGFYLQRREGWWLGWGWGENMLFLPFQ